jgi:hypothetical protein
MPWERDMMSPLPSAHHPLPFVDTMSPPPSRLVQACGMKSPACHPPSFCASPWGMGRDIMSPLPSAYHPLPFVDTMSPPPSRLVQARNMKLPACHLPTFCALPWGMGRDMMSPLPSAHHPPLPFVRLLAHDMMLPPPFAS